MLKFIFGRPCSGKTYTAIRQIKQLDSKGEKSVLLVPEQFSFEAEKEIVRKIGDRAALNVEVMSFSRICDEVCTKVGSISGKLLDDSDKIILMKRALAASKDKLVLWSKYAQNSSFAKSILDVIGEFKINAVSANELRVAAESAERASLKNKLLDIAEIYDNYNLVLGERFIDPADRLTVLYRQLEDYRYFENKTVFIDSFKGFTGQQYKILNRIFSQAKDIYVCFNYNGKKSGGYSLYSNIEAAIERIERIAKNNGVLVEKPLFLAESRYSNKSLRGLETLLCGEEFEELEKDNGVNICECVVKNDEANFVARTIRRLVRTENYRYRDFVIIARNAEDYEDAVELACQKNGIGCFTDKRIPLSSFPISVAVFSAISAAKSLTAESILRFHKTGLGTLNLDEISCLENYTSIWNINGKLWFDEWDMDVRGFVTDEPNEESVKKLEQINEYRKRALKPILDFKEAFFGNAKTMAKAIVKLLKDCEAAAALQNFCDDFKKLGNTFSSDALKQGYGCFMGILDSIVKCYGEGSIKKEEFIEALEIAVGNASVGTIPQTLDEVTFGSADRIRPSRPKIAFVLGANQGVFPQNIVSGGILSTYERNQLIKSNIEISDNSLESIVDENFLVYTSLCCATDRLYISYSTSTLIGEPIEKSSFIERIEENIPYNKFYEPDANLTEQNLPETTEDAFAVFCRNYKTNKAISETIAPAIDNSQFKSRVEAVRQNEQKKERFIESNHASLLYGNQLYMSASRLDVFNRCRFSYFCKYGLSLRKLQPAQFDVLQRGTIVHYVLEQAVKNYGEQLHSFDREKIIKIVDEYTNRYLDSVRGYRSVEDHRSQFIVSRITRLLVDVLEHLCLEFAQSKFKPTHCEMKIGGKDADIPELLIPYEKGDIHIRGSVDRVDEYNGYIRVIDYKTGSKSFKLPDILFGLNLQMLIYLYAVVRGQGKPDDKAAGIFYFQSKRDLNDNGMAMNGLARGNLELVTAMDKENSGEFVPKITMTSKGYNTSSSSFIDDDAFTDIFDHLEKYIAKTGNALMSGDISVNPIDGRESAACSYCDYAAICGIEDSEARKVPRLTNKKVIEMIREGEDNEA